MEKERRRILNLVENGTISAEEAIVLLEALSKEKESAQGNATSSSVPSAIEKEYSSTEKGHKGQRTKNSFEDMFSNMFNNKDTNKKMNEFFNDLKQDLSQFSSKVMDLMSTTYSKVKDFDFEFPFGEKIEFHNNYTFNHNEVDGLEIELPTGKIDFIQGDTEHIIIDAKVKTAIVNHDEIKTREEFEAQFIKIKEGKLDISTPSKMAQVSLTISLPAKQYEIVILRLLNGGVTVNKLDTKLLKIKTYNGAVKLDHVTFESATINGGNGSIELRNATGETVEAETINGKIYIDGKLQDIEAESVNGAVAVTTTSENARRVKASTMAGAVELYVPKNVSLHGQVTTNFGKSDIGLSDVTLHSEEDHILNKTAFFEKIVEDAPVLKLHGESRTGNIIVRYTLESDHNK